MAAVLVKEWMEAGFGRVWWLLKRWMVGCHMRIVMCSKVKPCPRPGKLSLQLPREVPRCAAQMMNKLRAPPRYLAIVREGT